MAEPSATSPGELRHDGARVDALVRAECVRALFDRLGVAQATVLANSAIVVAALRGEVAHARLLAWAGALWLVAAARLALGAAFRRARPPPEHAERWAARFTVGAAVNGVIWGAAPVVLGPGLPLPHLLLIAFVLAGMTAGAALSNASRGAAFAAFAAPALLPTTVLLLSGGERLRVAMGLLLVSFGAAVTAISRAGGRALADAVRLRFVNAALAGGLSAAARELEVRVEERTAQLAAASDREREASRQLAEASRLAVLGALAGGVAHEVNNPLTYLRANLNYVREELARLGLDPALAASIEEALADAGDGVERVRAIVRHLVALSRAEGRAEAGSVDLHAALDLCADMIQPDLEPRARLRRAYGAVPPVLGDRIRIVQVFLNLVRNAAQAIPPGDAARHEVVLSTRIEAESGLVVVEVTDTGRGIAAADLERIWDPFFTTRPVDEGTGLGLSICRNVLTALGGRAAVRSREGEGSTFTVWLRPAAEAGARPQGGAPGPSETVTPASAVTGLEDGPSSRGKARPS